LEALYLQWNHIKDTEALTALTKLQILNLERNQITSVLPLLARLPNLRLLDVRYNPLDAVSIRAIKNFNFLSSVAEVLFTEPE
jgi:Leucine-rich repeat (LRR) protein